MSEEYDKKIFAENLNYYLAKTGKTRAEIADYLKVSATTITYWCNAKYIPRMDKIEQMSNYFGIQKTDLIDKKEPAEIDELREKFIQLYDLIPPERRAAVLEVLRSVIKSFQEP